MSLKRTEGILVSLYRTLPDRGVELPELVEDIFIDPENGSDKTGDGSAAKPFKSVLPLERLWPKRVMP
jgi:hypothetical protein